MALLCIEHRELRRLQEQVVAKELPGGKQEALGDGAQHLQGREVLPRSILLMKLP